MKWQPIETAPTDGTRILLRGRNGKIADGHYGQPKDLDARKSWAESSVKLKDKRDAIGNGGVARTLWEVRITTSNAALSGCGTKE